MNKFYAASIRKTMKIREGIFIRKKKNIFFVCVFLDRFNKEKIVLYMCNVIAIELLIHSMNGGIWDE
jgi:hypothetical protein